MITRILFALFLSLPSNAFAISPFELPWMNHPVAGTTYKSSEHSCGVFVAEVYFNGCSDCNNNASNVNALAAEYLDNPRVQFLDIGRDSRQSDYTSWIHKHNPNHPVLNDSGKLVISQLGTRWFPTVYIIDFAGVVRFSHEDFWDDVVKQQIRDKIGELLNEPCP